jgi:MerR family copper efflux transcriptional regulator
MSSRPDWSLPLVAVQRWLASQAYRPQDVEVADWLRFEQDKHEKLLAAAA